MKRIVSFLLILVLMLTMLASCDLLAVEPTASKTGEPSGSEAPTSPSTPSTTPSTTPGTAQTTAPITTPTTPGGGNTPPEPQINYGTAENPVSVTYAYTTCADFKSGESSANPFYVKGTVTRIGETGSYYKNVYFTDGTTEMLIYTVNMGEGISGFKVGDTVTVCGYIKNYNGTIEMATYNGTVYVYVLKVESAGGNNQNHLYTSFTASEKDLMKDTVGTTIPFIPNDEYYVEGYTYENEIGVNFYAFGNTQAEFDAYRALFSDYTFDGTDVDEYGDTWYFYSNGDVYVDMTFYYYEGSYVVDVYVYISDENSGSGEGGTTDPTDRTYTDFTADEKSLMTDIVGLDIPFIPNGEYYVEEYDLEGEYGVNFYAVGNTQAEFDAYRALFSGYTFDGTDVDDYGDTWYFYSKGDVYVDMSFYYYEGVYIVDVYVYVMDENGGSGEEGGNETPDTLITNNGKGLPESPDGIFEVDFTNGVYVKDVTDQGYYIDGCPTTGSPAILVIPVEFVDVTAQSKGYTVENLQKIFNGTGNDTVYCSVRDYFFASSYGKLDLDITVLDNWFRPQYNSAYYENATYDYSGYEIAIGDQLVLDEALAYLATVMDLSAFDSDGNGMIDAVVLVYTMDIGEDDFHWAYRYWNVYTDDEGYYFEYDGVSANDYLWASYQFIFEGYDENGEVNYDASNPLNPYTYIHEMSHVLGADDYYDTEYVGSPMGGYDIMDSMSGDHNPYTKFNFGWITASRLIVTDSTVTVSLEAFAKNGDTILLATNWDETLGAYQEYYVIMYYTATGLNAGEGGYFTRDGIVVYHVNSSLYAEEIDGETYYDVYNSNTDPSGEYGTENNLIEFVLTDEGHYTYVAGDTLPELTDDAGNALGYTFTVDSVTDDGATLTFVKK
jgi:M6 family metalloprotease-like protein